MLETLPYWLIRNEKSIVNSGAPKNPCRASNLFEKLWERRNTHQYGEKRVKTPWKCCKLTLRSMKKKRVFVIMANCIVCICVSIFFFKTSGNGQRVYKWVGLVCYFYWAGLCKRWVGLQVFSFYFKLVCSRVWLYIYIYCTVLLKPKH